MSINKVIISGHVGKKPELKKTDSGKSWVKFSVATTEEWKDKTTGKKMENTDWHQMRCWGKLAEAVAQWVVAGQYLEIEGKHKCKKVEKEGQQTQYYDYIQALEITFGPKPQSYWKEQEAKKAAAAQAQPASGGTLSLNDIANTLQKLNAAVAQLTGSGAAPAQLPAPPAGTPTRLVADDEAEEYAQPYQPPAASAPIAAGL